ncbi:hypothetical protein PybrP1_005959 [[Pythium] brassicae (nom. inval.)]|nr:hypothetical protein PybrP1_005959 [[Pythium] brassicae (nom. inval.)]
MCACVNACVSWNSSCPWLARVSTRAFADVAAADGDASDSSGGVAALALNVTSSAPTACCTSISTLASCFKSVKICAKTQQQQQRSTCACACA